MIEQIQELQGALPFSYEQRGSVIVSSSAIVTDLLFMEEVNALVIKNFSIFQEGVTPAPTQSFFDSLDGDDEVTLKSYGLNDAFTEILLGLATEIDTSLLGIQITSPQKEMCPSFHVDKLPLRIVQCFNSKGPTLKSNIGEIIETEENDLVFLKGEMWRSDYGGIIHRSPETDEAREIIRIDFLN